MRVAEKQKARFPAGLLQRHWEGKPGGDDEGLAGMSARIEQEENSYNQVGW